MKKICIVGQGYVGLSISLAAYSSYEIIGFDIDEKKINTIKQGKSPLFEVANSDIQRMINSGHYICTTDPTVLSDCEIVVIAVPTPLDKERKPDLSILENACQIIKDNIADNTLVINESTSYPGTLRKLIKPIIEKSAKSGLEFAASPERVNPGSEKYNQKNTPRLYSGLTDQASQQTREFYAAFCETLVQVESPEIAESAKLFENSFRQVNIAFVNEFATIMNQMQIPVNKVLDAANTKPFGIMKFTPGIGVGGHCIPVDPSYLAWAARESGIAAEFIELANKVNNNMPDYVISRLEQEFGLLSDKIIQVVGIAYKPNVSDFRESPAIALINRLRSKDIRVNWCDPVVGTWENESSSKFGVADIIIIAVAHDTLITEFAKLDKSKVIDLTGTIENVPGI